jgi:hypothetical protein
VSRVDSSNSQLTKTADDHSVDEEDPAATPLGDDRAIDNDDDDSNGGQDAVVHEWRSDIGHLEEVCSVGCDMLVWDEKWTGPNFLQIMYMAPDAA